MTDHEHTCIGCGALENEKHKDGCARAHHPDDLVMAVDLVSAQMPQPLSVPVAAAPGPLLTVELKSGDMDDGEANQEAFAVVLSGAYGDVSYAMGVDRAQVEAEMAWLVQCLSLALGSTQVVVR